MGPRNRTPSERSALPGSSGDRGEASKARSYRGRYSRVRRPPVIRTGEEEPARPPAAYSGWRLLRLRVWLGALYTVYAGWFIVDFFLTVYIQMVKMGGSAIESKHMEAIVDYIHPDRGPSALELSLVTIPKLVTFTWVFVSISVYYIVLLSFKDEPDLHLADFLRPEDYPTVDVMLPRYKEPWSLFKPTVDAALRLDYPHDKLHVYICDDGRDPELRQHLEDELGLGTRDNLHYLTRPDGRGAKGGNLNNALANSSGDLISVLDADMLVKEEFLLQTVPHLLQWDTSRTTYTLQQIAFVQVAQCFYNESTWMVILMDGPNRMFYSLAMVGLNGLNAAPIVGTNFVMQRRALDDIGGFVSRYCVEDVVTALMMHNKGWKSCYKNSNLVVGLSPATLSEFFKQRLRWSAGSVQLVWYLNPLGMRGLTLGQALGYFTSHNYWLISLVTTLLMLLRYFFWILYLGITGPPANQGHRLQLLPSQYIPTLGVLFLLPVCTILDKVGCVMSMLAYTPVYAKLTWLWLLGHLHPASNKVHLKASSESYGDSIPKLALYNMLLILSVTIASVLFMILPRFGLSPRPDGPLFYVQLTTLIIFVWFGNFPVAFEVVRLLGLYIRRKAGQGEETGEGEGEEEATRVNVVLVAEPGTETDIGEETTDGGEGGDGESSWEGGNAHLGVGVRGGASRVQAVPANLVLGSTSDESESVIIELPGVRSHQRHEHMLRNINVDITSESDTAVDLSRTSPKGSAGAQIEGRRNNTTLEVPQNSDNNWETPESATEDRHLPTRQPDHPLMPNSPPPARSLPQHYYSDNNTDSSSTEP